MSLQHAFEIIDHDLREKVHQETWGHLAPKKNKSYKGYIIWALGIYGSDNLNPTVLESKGMPDGSPWFFENMIDFLHSIDKEGGTVWKWVGTFKNYEFIGNVIQLHIPGMSGCTIKRFNSKLTKQNFQKIAEEIKSLSTLKERKQRVCQVLPELKESNPRFNEKLFRMACNIS